MTREDKDVLFMEEALKQAFIGYEKDEVPVGAVLTRKDKIIARAYNQVELLKDPTAHAEMLALTGAAYEFRTKWLLDCTLYVTLEPCLMCAGAMVLARISRLVFGAFDPKSGAFGSRIQLNQLNLNHKIEVRSGLMEKDCAFILKKFFQNKRVKLN